MAGNFTGEHSPLNNLRFRVAVRLMRYAVQVMPPGDARTLLHQLHLSWCEECKRQWELRYGDVLL